MNIEKLNSRALEVFDEYLKLDVDGVLTRTPYFINNIEKYFTDLMKRAGVNEDQIGLVKKGYREMYVPYGWYRGKGTPKELITAIHEISKLVGLPVDKSKSETIRNVMTLFGIGVDCSGLVFNLLNSALSDIGQVDFLENTLDWGVSDKKTVYQAGAFTFAGNASNIVNKSDLQALDLILLFSKSGNKYNHIALIVNVENKLHVVQSSIASPEHGVRIDPLYDKLGRFGYKPDIGKSWDELYKSDRLEFRRLKGF